jgi:unsaturated rhamnogalacturonyl hydrolase
VVLAEAGDEDAGTHVLGLVERILQYQDHASGLWRTVIDRPDCYLETSASAMFGYGLARAAAGSFVPFSHEAISGCWRGLTDYVTSEGRVLGVSAGTPPGAFAEYNSVPQGSETFGTGFVILLGLELAATLARKT